MTSQGGRRHPAWDAFASDAVAPDIVTAFRMSEAAEGVDPALVLRLFESTAKLHDGSWPRLADPLFDVDGLVRVFRAARDRLEQTVEAALRIGLVRAGALDAGEITEDEVLGCADAALREATSGDGSPDALREGESFGAARWQTAILDRLACSDTLDSLPEASAEWLLQTMTSPRDRVLCKLRTRDAEGAPLPLPIESPEEDAALNELVHHASDLSDSVAFAALAALDARGFDRAPPRWEALLRPNHLGLRQDFGEAPAPLSLALRRASVATRGRLLAARPAFPWLVADAFRGVPGAHARAKHEARSALRRGDETPKLEDHEVYEIERGVAALGRRPSRRSRRGLDGLPPALVRAIEAGLDALDADAFAQVPRGISSRVVGALAEGASSLFLTNERLDTMLEGGAELAIDSSGRTPLLAIRANASVGGSADHWRSRIHRLIELHAPEPVLARDISSLRLAQRFPRTPDTSSVFAYPDDEVRSRGLRRQLQLAVLVGERVAREVAPASKLAKIAPKLLRDLVRLRDGQDPEHRRLGDLVEDVEPGSPSARRSWAACAYLYVQAEHFTGNPRCTIQDTPLDLAQQAFMPKGFWKPEGHRERRRFWAWLLLTAAPDAYRFASM